MGDPAGVGPEIIVKACQCLLPKIEEGALRISVLGSVNAFRDAQSFLGIELPTVESDGADEDAPRIAGSIALMDVDPERPDVPLGEVSEAGGRYSFLAIEKAVDWAQRGIINAMVTAPLNKEALNLAGYRYSGHTDMLANLTGVSGSVMMLAHGHMRVTHVSTHVALDKVPSLLTAERLERVVDLTYEALIEIGLSNPRIAVAALNPHAGEGGIFGREDIDVTTPFIEECRARGRDVVGPIPGDTVFVKLHGHSYDAVVAMYHDQGHIPIKLLGFQTDPETGRWKALNGVNVTLGLPIIRTSVDHGTAFDIAGQGIANEQSLIEAVDYAITLSKGRAARSDAQIED